MNFLSNLKISQRLALGFAAVITLLIALASFGLSRIYLLDRDTEMIVHDRYAKIALLHKVENEVNRQSRALRTALIAADDVVMPRELDKLAGSAAEVASALEQLGRTVSSEQGKQHLQTLLTARQSFVQHEHHIVELIRTQQSAAARDYLVNDIIPAQSAYLNAIEALVEFQAQSMEHLVKEADDTANLAGEMMVAVTLIATVLAILVAFYLSRSIIVPLRRAVQVAETVAAGDLRSQIGAVARDETGQLLLALKRMNESLANIVGQVRSGSETISGATGQIAAGNQDLSARTEQQAGALEETASSMEEITMTVRESGENARRANQLAVSASQVAAQGGGVVAEVIETMGAIDASSRQIVDIIGVIDGIAFQTNILALNASVEAARAGEQGRGFAVVATEVRDLAQRSAAAAKQIKVLISNSVEQVQKGSLLVGKAGQTMNDIVASVQRVTDIMGDIAAASEQQSSGIEQINQAVTEMDAVTQQNAALVEEAAAASESLLQQTHALNQLVSIFQLGDAGAGKAAAQLLRAVPSKGQRRALGLATA